MEDQRTGPEETLMEVMVGMNGVAGSHPARARPRRCCFTCLLALATLLALAISLVAALMVYIFIIAPQCNPVRATWGPACLALAATLVRV